MTSSLAIRLETVQCAAGAEPDHKTARHQQQYRACDKLLPGVTAQNRQNEQQAKLQEECRNPAARSGEKERANGHQG